MAYLDYPGLNYFKSLLDETYLRTSYTGDTTIAGDVTFTGNTVFSEDITGNVDGKAKKDWRGQQIDSTYIKEISTNDNVGQIVYTKGDGTSNYIMIDMMQGATASAAGKAGLVPAPTISERTKFLRGDGEWGVPTDIYVTQNLINTNDSFPILIGATAGATESQIGTAIAFGTKVSVNPNTHALIADHLILKHPTYRRDNAVTSKVMYTLNFADSNDGNGNNLSEIYGYIDKPSEGGEHELGFRLFGNPNVQGVEEIFTYLSVGLSNTNIPYGHAPKTPVPADHNEDTDIITRSYLALNGSITGLVHTTMPETIDGTKTFIQKIVAQDGMNATGNVATDSLTVRQNATVGGTLGVTGTSTLDGNVHMLHNIDVDGTANVDGASTLHGDVHMYNNLDVDKNANIDGNETVGGTLITTGKITGNNGLKITGNTTTDTLTVSGNETVGGTLTVTGKITGNSGVDTTTLHATDDVIADDDLTVGDTITVGGQILRKTGTSTTQEYVNYITNQSETKTTIINNLIDPDQGLKLITKGTGANAKDYIAFKIGNGLTFHSANNDTGNKGQVDVDFSQLPPEQVKNIVDRMVDPDGAIIGNNETTIPEGTVYHYYNENGQLVSATAPAGGITNPNYGKLTVDFDKLPPKKMRDIAQSIIAPGGGLYYVATEFLQAGATYVDSNGTIKTVTPAQAAQTANGFPNPNYGKLLVDFSQIDEDTKAEIIAALDMQVPLRSSKTFYVNKSGTLSSTTIINNTKVTDIIKSPASYKFTTIQNCVNWVTTNLSVGPYTVTILVEANVENGEKVPTEYNESISLPMFNVSRGSIVLQADLKELEPEVIETNGESVTYPKYERLITITPPRNSAGLTRNAFAVTGPKWTISYFIINCLIRETTSVGSVVAVISSQGEGQATLRGLSITQRFPRKEGNGIPDYDHEVTNVDQIDFYYPEYSGDVPAGRYISNSFGIRIIEADGGGKLTFAPDSKMGFEINTEIVVGTGLGVDVLSISRGGSVTFNRSTNETAIHYKYYEIKCFGTCSTFASVWQNGHTNVLGAGELIRFVDGIVDTNDDNYDDNYDNDLTNIKRKRVTGRPFSVRGGSNLYSLSVPYPGGIYTTVEVEGEGSVTRFYKYYSTANNSVTELTLNEFKSNNVDTNTYSWYS